MLAVGVVTTVAADAPRTSLRPVARPAAVLVAPPLPTLPDEVHTTAPQPLRPQSRPPGLTAPSVTVETRAERRARERALRRAGTTAGGGICGDPGLAGVAIGAVPGPGGCGIDTAVRLTAVSGVQLSTAATVDCVTAKALKRWVDGSLIPQVGARGGGVASLRVAASYACRTRNSQQGARLSEHAQGHAIDISGLTFRDGTSLSVLRDWGGGRDGRLLKSLHRGACGPFGTVLGPESDRFHRDHFHFDTARYRSGPYCR